MKIKLKISIFYTLLGSHITKKNAHLGCSRFTLQFSKWFNVMYLLNLAAARSIYKNELSGKTNGVEDRERIPNKNETKTMCNVCKKEKKQQEKCNPLFSA